MAYAQQTMQPGEDLATLFSRHMTFEQPQQNEQAPQTQSSQQFAEPEGIQYSITQHYHHSSHLVHRDEPPAEPQRPSSAPPYEPFSAEYILSSHGVNPQCLSPQQLQLFKTADIPQQIRLVELWQICPPTNSQSTPAPGLATHEALEQEEIHAQLRHEQRLAEEDARRNSLMSMDGTPLTPVQTTDGHWVSTANAEPYMMSGYEMLARREYEETVKKHFQEEMSRPKEVYGHLGNAVDGYRLATDPVYASDWPRQQQAMEDQYGAFQQMGGMEF
ncbi:hypothetical protein SAMD00023353_3100950 [Rosellinia necatrix]|uniref:Uncharacterized protein n=1 Tax=Rosellinia necatrix TaxID=77044 RepID=A0A1W2TSK8_ROSNE|nr:hypothetical protein SAMD00023353_3100950 [Rosellinia necatrix]